MVFDASCKYIGSRPSLEAEINQRHHRHHYTNAGLFKAFLEVPVIEIPPFVYIQSQKTIDSTLNSLEKEAKKLLDKIKSRAQKYSLKHDYFVRVIQLHLLSRNMIKNKVI